MQGASLSVAKDSGSISKGGQDGLACEAWMGGQQVIERPARAELIENVLDRDTGACHDRLAHHDLGISDDQILVHPSLTTGGATIKPSIPAA